MEKKIALNKFKPRDYQIPLFEAIENKDYKKALLIWHRRAGKDMACFQLAIRQCLKKTCLVFYLFPTYAQAKKALWDAVTIDGFKILDYIPSEVIKAQNNQEMKITFINNSILQFVGSDNYNSLMGTNPYMCIFSEYSLSDPTSFSYIRPAVLAQDGIIIFNSTPRGKNHLFTLYEAAMQNDDWFVSKLTIEDTNAIPIELIQKEFEEGRISEDLLQQEWYCSFSRGIEGSIYSKLIDKMRLEHRIGNVPWDIAHSVNTAWDIGRDTTSICFYQVIGPAIYVIDYYEKKNENLEYFVGIINSKPYNYNKHWFPHDMRVTEWGGPKFTRVEKARQLGIKARIVPDVGLEDGIEYTKSQMSRMYIDQTKCEQLIKCLESYHREYDAKKEIYSHKPVHNWASHGADSARYMALSIPLSGQGTSPEDIDRRYQEAMQGPGGNLPEFFR